MKISHLFPIIAIIAAFSMTTLSSCKSDNSEDVEDILLTIPSDASVVAVANTLDIIEKSGAKIKDGKIEAPTGITEKISNIKDARTRTIFTTILDGNSGIDNNVAVIFREGYNTFFTAHISNTSDFKAMAEKSTGKAFSSDNGVDISGNIAIKDSQFWINLDQHSIDSGDIRHFTSLDKNQSFVSNDFADRLIKFDSDVIGWCNINALINTSGLDFQNRATARIVLETLFDDAMGATFAVNFLTGKMVMTASLINSKGKNASFRFPSETVDVNTIAQIGGTADMLAAIAVPSKVVKKLKEDTSSKQPSMLGMILPALSCIDGTVAFAANSDDALSGVAMTDGSSTAAFTDLLSNLDFRTSADGKLVRFRKGDLKGIFNVADQAALLKGVIAGVAVANPSHQLNVGSTDIESAVFAIVPDNGVSLRLTLTTFSAKQNFLKSILAE